MKYIYSAIGGLILVFIVLILRKKKNGTADYLLISINVTLGLFLLSDVLVHWHLNSFTLIFQNSVPLLLLPVFIFFALHYTHHNKTIPIIWYGLFVPLILMLAISIVDHFILNSYKQSDVLLKFNAPSLVYQFLFKGSQILFIIVLFHLLRKLKSFNYRIKDGYSSTEEIDLNWLANFTRIYLIIMATSFVLFLIQILAWLPFSVDQVYSIIYTVLIIGILIMTYQGIQHYTIDQVISTSSQVELNVISPKEKKNEIEQRRSLTAEEENFESNMLNVIEKQKLYLNPQLSLKDLALTLNASTHFVSKVINSKSKRSFYDLINQYRVAYLKQLLENPEFENLTILALGLDSGFNSKASLNRVFKKHAGLTPKQYLNQINVI